MRKEYDFSKGKRGAYNSRVKKQITIKIDEATIKYFKALADETGVAYQNLINLYLRECATKEKSHRLNGLSRLRNYCVKSKLLYWHEERRLVTMPFSLCSS